ncbi:MAG TPA: ferritin-like domain-containing protein [Kofleriaceae bacterium]|nr:ferritin-like domain-containing protein [Kofleriaceae bacterium]
MDLVGWQRTAVDAIKRDAIVRSVASPRAESYILGEYLWSEEGAERSALQRVLAGSPHEPWLAKLIGAQLADERRHARLLRDRIAELGAVPRPAPALAQAKLWWLERSCARYGSAFAAGPIVVVLAAAAQLEATGVRMLRRHLDVLEARAVSSPTARVIRAILADEKRHAASCAAAAERLVCDDERVAFAELRERVARIDRAFGVTLAVRYWCIVASRAALERAREAA